MIKINEKYYIKSDDNQFMLCEKGTIQDKESKNYGNDTETILGYYGTLEHSLEGLEKINIRRQVNSKELTLKQAIEEIKKLHNELRNLIKGE